LRARYEFNKKVQVKKKEQKIRKELPTEIPKLPDDLE